MRNDPCLLEPYSTECHSIGPHQQISIPWHSSAGIPLSDSRMGRLRRRSNPGVGIHHNHGPYKYQRHKAGSVASDSHRLDFGRMHLHYHIHSIGFIRLVKPYPWLPGRQKMVERCIQYRGHGSMGIHRIRLHTTKRGRI